MNDQNTNTNFSRYDNINDLFFMPGMQQVNRENNKSNIIIKNSTELFLNTVIICPPTIDWNWMKQRPQQLMEQFAKHGFEIYYCNKTQSAGQEPEKIHPNITIIHNNKKFIAELIPYIKSQGKKILLWVSWPRLHSFLYQYHPDFVIFDYIDGFPDWSLYLDKMVSQANVVITTTLLLKRYIDQNYPYKPCFLVPNGCDICHFQNNTPLPKPVEYIGHDGPIICYTGAWASWVDQNLVIQLARSIPKALITIIGVEFIPPIDKFMKNIKHIGYKPYEVLPQYIHYSDVCIIPFKINKITQASNPIKMYEYLAAGKPVVSTNIPEVRNVPNVYVSKDNNAFISCVNRLLNYSISSDKEIINTWLVEQTWESRFKNIMEILQNYRNNL